MWSKTWRRYLVPAGRLAAAQLALLSTASLLPAQDGNAAVRRQPLPPIHISTKDPTNRSGILPDSSRADRITTANLCFAE